MWAFADCSALTSIILPDGVTSIGLGAFRNCASLTNITLPDSVTIIEDSVFYGCIKLTDITYNGTLAQWDAVAKHYLWDTNTSDYTIHCTDVDITKN